jgi:O-antigen ligase
MDDSRAQLYGGPPILSLAITWTTMAPLALLCLGCEIPFLTDMKTAVLLLCWILVIFCIAQRTAHLFEQCWRAKYSFVIPAIAILSTLWSQDPPRTLLKGLCLLLVTVFAVYLVNRYNSEEIIHIFYIVGNTLLVLSVVYCLAFPGSGIGPEGWRGAFHTKNDAARVIAFLFPSALYYKPRLASGEIMRKLFLGATCVFLLLTRSVTGLASVAILILLYSLWALIRRLAATEKGITVALSVFAALALASLAYYYAKDILPLFGKDITLTGRTKIWSSVIRSIAKRPWLGYGHGAFWTGQGEATNTYLVANWTVPYAHNGFLDVLLQIGFVGLAAVCFVFVKAVKDTALDISAKISGYAFWCLSILLMTFVFNLDEGTFISEERIYWLLFLVVSVGMHRPNRLHEREAAFFAN